MRLLRYSYYPLALFLSSNLHAVTMIDQLSAWLTPSAGHGSAYMLLLAVLGGLLSALMPCVYPMIPITIAVIGAKQAKNKEEALLRGLLFMLGLSLIYALLGVTAALSGSLLGTALQRPWLVGSIAIFYIVMGLALLGLFEFRLPYFINRGLVALDGNRGLVGVFFTGIISGVVAAPCVGPVVASLLLFVATTKAPVLGFSLLFFYAAGLSLPFVVLGVFSAQLQRLPKSGAWMQKVKVLFGLGLIIAGLYFLQPTLKTWMQRPSTPVSTNGGIAWQTDLDQALQQARANKKPVMVDFFAEWCLACKELDHYTYRDAAVIAMSQKFINVKLDFTRLDKSNEAIMRRYQIMALPAILFFDEQGRQLPELRIDGFVEAKVLLKTMQKLQAPAD